MKLLKTPLGKAYINEHFVDVYESDDIINYFNAAQVTTDIKEAVDNLSFKNLKEGDKYFLEYHELQNIGMFKLFQVHLENYQLTTTLKEYFYVRPICK